MPLPDHDFDVTEVAVPWRLLTRAGHVVRFATERGGSAPAADQRLLDGVIFGQLGASDEPKTFYAEMQSRRVVPRAAGMDGRRTRRVRRSLTSLPGGHESPHRMHDGSAFVVEDDNYVSARWPGDAYLFAKRFADRLGD